MMCHTIMINLATKTFEQVKGAGVHSSNMNAL